MRITVFANFFRRKRRWFWHFFLSFLCKQQCGERESRVLKTHVCPLADSHTQERGREKNIWRAKGAFFFFSLPFSPKKHNTCLPLPFLQKRICRIQFQTFFLLPCFSEKGERDNIAFPFPVIFFLAEKKGKKETCPVSWNGRPNAATTKASQGFLQKHFLTVESNSIIFLFPFWAIILGLFEDKNMRVEKVIFCWVPSLPPLWHQDRLIQFPLFPLCSGKVGTGSCKKQKS